MKIIKNHLNTIENTRILDHFFTNQTIFFDIETTGFSSVHNTVYLIGAAYYSNNEIHTIQFFADTPDEEADVLNQFMEFIAQFTTTITFNGVAFDIPFIEKRCDALSLPCTLAQMKHIDLFKEIKRCAKFLSLDSYKQKSIEEFLGIYRTDKYNGGELISVYNTYCFTPDPEALELLLLHNEEDVIGMFDLMRMLAYPALLDRELSFQSACLNNYTSMDGQPRSEVIFTFQTNYPVPVPIFFKNEFFSFKANICSFSLIMPLIDGTMKYFFPDYKNYYYLPAEDRAYHKSVSAFVSSERKQKAKASTCYQKTTGQFLYEPEKIFEPAFQPEFRSKEYYFQYKEDMAFSNEQLRNYVSSLLSNI